MMKKGKTLRQLLGLALSAAMLTGMVGCGSTDAEQTSKGSTEETKQSIAQEKVESKETVVEEEGITYPLDTDVELSIWTHRVKPNAAYDDVSESPFHTGLAEKTGVTLDWWINPETSEKNGYNLLMADGNLPDIIQKGWDLPDAEALLAEGVIWDLTDYIPKYAPDYWAAINQPQYQDVLRSATTQDGRQFCVAAFVEGDYNICYQGPVVRKDWLDECGLDVPVTLEDWEEMLTAFKEKYGVAYGDSYVLSSRLGFNSGTGAYSNAEALWYLDDDGKVQLAQTQPEWKEHITNLNRWWENDLIDKDSLTMDAAALRTKAANNLIGASFVAMSALSNFATDAEQTGAEWIGVGYPREAEGVPTCAINMNYCEWSANMGAVITKNCSEEEMIEALKFLNYGFTEEGIMYWAYGEEGVSYTLNSAGEPKWTDLVLNDEQGVTNAISKYTGSSNNPLSIQQTKLVQMKNIEVAQEAVYTWIDNNDASRHCLPLTLSYTDDENLVYSEKFTAIKTYVKETAMKFITGEADIETEYDAFIAQLKKMGLEECQAIQQAAYERFLAK